MRNRAIRIGLAPPARSFAEISSKEFFQHLVEDRLNLPDRQTRATDKKTKKATYIDQLSYAPLIPQAWA
jgi:hypothetical protein